MIALVAATSAVVAAIVIMMTRDDDAGPGQRGSVRPARPIVQRTTDRGARPTLERPGAPVVTSDRVRPQLVLPKAPQSFATEERDPAWSTTKEGSVSKRVAELLGDAALQVSKVECRTQQCRFAVSGREADDFASFVELIQGQDGFGAEASQLMLQDYAPAGDDGSPASVTVVLRYARDIDDAQ